MMRTESPSAEILSHHQCQYRGHFDIPDTIRSNQLICRAYTGWMMNFDEDFLFTGPSPFGWPACPSNPLPATDFKLVFFPEGGDIIEGERTTSPSGYERPGFTHTGEWSGQNARFHDHCNHFSIHPRRDGAF
ncbi:MAG: hypothetical protein IPI66_04705 [Chitinophagaceae bacterium]|nr:hypothetical protein [Chitinophagaceae bacterium]